MQASVTSHRVYVMGVKGKDKGETDKKKKWRLVEGMVDWHCFAEKQAALSALKMVCFC